MGQRATGAKNPFPAIKIQHKQLNFTLMENIPSQLLIKTEEDAVDDGGKKESTATVDEKEAIDLTVAD
jgi:hypothetical protein